MRARKKTTILDDYKMANDEKRVRIILDNYPGFMTFVNAYEFGLVDTIKAERLYNRRAAIGDTGVRVQTSNIGNPTSSEGDEDKLVREAVRAGDYITALRGADRYEKHKWEILTLKDMRETYALVDKQIGTLEDEKELFRRYLRHEFNLATIAGSEGVTVEAMKKRFKNARNDVIDNTLFWLEMKRPYLYLDQKGA
ncbi:hypothetical protein [Butyrivibrio sp. XPD2006]|uniref:hypothetical protein n=1 Tax=Butyrivibrio sp. XPD2006 TaxID=1280668 RepID=UPI0003B58D91|nr:hypothetical protein [Butyrivibrio sp. XPD2006]